MPPDGRHGLSAADPSGAAGELHATCRGRLLLTVGIHLGNVSLLAERSGDLLLPLGPAKTTQGKQVASVVDLINRRFGAEKITHGINQPHHGFFKRG